MPPPCQLPDAALAPLDSSTTAVDAAAELGHPFQASRMSRVVPGADPSQGPSAGLRQGPLGQHHPPRFIRPDSFAPIRSVPRVGRDLTDTVTPQTPLSLTGCGPGPLPLSYLASETASHP